MISELSKKIESLKMLQKEANEQKKQSYSHVNNKDGKITELTNKLNIQTDVNKQQEKKLAEMEKKICDFKSNQKKANSQPKSKETINQPKFFGSEDKELNFDLPPPRAVYQQHEEKKSRDSKKTLNKQIPNNNILK